MRRRRRIGCSAAATNGLKSCSPRHDRCKSLACLNAATVVDSIEATVGWVGTSAVLPIAERVAARLLRKGRMFCVREERCARR